MCFSGFKSKNYCVFKNEITPVYHPLSLSRGTSLDEGVCAEKQIFICTAELVRFFQNQNEGRQLCDAKFARTIFVHWLFIFFSRIAHLIKICLKWYFCLNVWSFLFSFRIWYLEGLCEYMINIQNNIISKHEKELS